VTQVDAWEAVTTTSDGGVGFCCFFLISIYGCGKLRWGNKSQRRGKGQI